MKHDGRNLKASENMGMVCICRWKRKARRHDLPR
jgi:hypothetical protein